jgi:hypothetical protein
VRCNARYNKIVVAGIVFLKLCHTVNALDTECASTSSRVTSWPSRSDR